MSHRPVPAGHLRELIEHAERAGAWLLPVTGAAMRERLVTALAAGAHRQEYSAGYAVELELWTRRYTAARDGIPRTNIVTAPAGRTHAAPLRWIPHGRHHQPQRLLGQEAVDEAVELFVIATPGDTEVDRLRAGEATSAVLLAATRLGLATTSLSQGIEIDTTRRAIQRDVLQVPEQPQLLIRVGWRRPTPPSYLARGV